jgi:phage terminase large subunit-like protein
MHWQKTDSRTWLAEAFTPLQWMKAAPEWMFEGKIKLNPKGQPQTWLVMGGRGAGKTRLGAEWVNCLAHGMKPFSGAKTFPIALVGETIADVRDVMIEGPAGIKASSRLKRPRYIASKRQLVWETGQTAMLFSSEDPESLRGPQFAAAWCDEIGKWKNGVETWDMLQFGLRLGDLPRIVATTTPRPTALMKRLLADKDVAQTIVRTAENAAHLAPGFLDKLNHQYGGTRLGRQELEGELLEDRQDALWKRGDLEKIQGLRPEKLNRIVIAVDPPATSTKRSDACGIIAAGLDREGIGWVLSDQSFRPAPPRQWAEKAVALFHQLEADRIVVEVNQGGDMVSAIIRQVDPNVPVRPVNATRSKWLRCEPVAALYEQGRVRHAGRFAALEDEMCDFSIEGLSGGRSPDRLDALVWALTELMLKERAAPRIRNFT